MVAMSRLKSFIAGAVSVAIVIGVLALTGVLGGSDDTASTPAIATATATATPAVTSTTPVATSAPATSVADIYKRVSPGVVFVEADGGAQSASGSGFVIDGQGHIVTNEHVVEAGRTYKVRFGENGDPVDAKLLGSDRSSDLALLKVDPAKVGDALQPLQLGSSDSLQPGDATIAIGSPFGLEGTVTSGIVSGLDRTIQAPNGFSISGAVQTDAAINPGNSGGPLLDGDGRVIGVNSQIATRSGSSSGVGFAVPVDQVKRVVPFLQRGAGVPHAYMGIASGDAQAGGAQVGDVVAGGPAAKAGIRAGDRIVQIARQPVRESDDIAAVVNDHRPGEKIDVVVERGGQRRTLTVTLGSQPNQPSQN
jgi:putative serine protease PepD